MRYNWHIIKHIVTISTVSHSCGWIHISICYHSSSVWRSLTFFYAVSADDKCSQLDYVWKSLYIIFCFEDIFAGYEILGCEFLAFHILKMFIHHLLTCFATNKTFSVILIFTPLYIMCFFFFLAAFKSFLFIMCFEKLNCDIL